MDIGGGVVTPIIGLEFIIIGAAVLPIKGSGDMYRPSFIIIGEGPITIMGGGPVGYTVIPG